MPQRLRSKLSRTGATLVLTTRTFIGIDGTQRAAAFAYYAFFSIFPLVVLFVTAASTVVDRDLATRRVVAYFENFAPVAPEMRQQVFDMITHLVKARARFSLFASAVLFWGALQFFKALIRATNRAWGEPTQNWWHMPLKSFTLVAVMGSSVGFGITLSVLKKSIRTSAAYAGSSAIPASTVVFSLLSLGILIYTLAFFYKIAPRRATYPRDIWAAAVGAALLLRGLEFVFVYYLRHFSQLNAIYGAFGSLMALLLWIYFSGCIIILGACLSASLASLREGGPPEPAASGF